MPFVTEMILRSLANPLFSQYQWMYTAYSRWSVRLHAFIALVGLTVKALLLYHNWIHYILQIAYRTVCLFFCTSVYCVKVPPYGFPAFTGCGYRHQSELPQQRSGHKRSLRCPCGRSSRERHQTAASWFDRRRGWGTANRAHQGMSWLVTLSWTCAHMFHLGLLCLLSLSVNIQREMMWYRHGMI